MREYERRIYEHKKRLPRIREQITAALILFIVSSLMLTVVTFSWLTLSTAPEVSNTALTISSNGSLEIALARDILRDEQGNPVLDSNGSVIPLAPGASGVGDSSLELSNRNTTWGNLVNLSDSIYGLENIVLRPATLNHSQLLTQPLLAAKYSSDGRIEELRSEFAYTQWNNELRTFQSSDLKGVKAISSVKYDTVEYDNPLLGAYDQQINKITATLVEANKALKNLSSHDSMRAIDGIMSTYMNGTLRQNVDAELCTSADIGNFYTMMVAVDNGPMTIIGNAFMQVIELYQLDTYGVKNSTEPGYDRFTDLDMFCATINDYISDMNDYRANIKDADGNPTPKDPIVLADDFPDLVIYLSDRAKLKQYINELEAYLNSNTPWKNIKHIVNYVVDIDSCLIIARGETEGYTVSQLTGNLGAHYQKLLNMIQKTSDDANSKPSRAIVTNGLMKRLDLMLYSGTTGFATNACITIDGDALKARIDKSSMSFVNDLGLVDKVLNKDNQTGKSYGYGGAIITTNAIESNKTASGEQSTLGTAYANAARAREIVGAKAVVKTFIAQDTYGLSIDFWVRTNSLDSFLTLEGRVVYDYIDVTRKVTAYDSNGEASILDNVQIYTVIVKTHIDTNGEISETTQEQEVFQVNGTWYLASNGLEIGKTITEALDDGTQRAVTRTLEGTPEKKQDRIPVDYTSSNRIWTEEELGGMSESQFRTTQGAGSCYTYYADPAEKMQINQILSALKIAFIGADGQVLANARLATEFCFSEYGKHTVPIVLDNSSIDTGMLDANGDVLRAIMQLEKNKATLITAIIYLEGNEVTNDKVLSFSNIEGNFNIQFGCTQSLDSIKNEELMGEEIVVSATVTNENGVANPNIDYFDGMNETGYKTVVTLTIDGATPSSVHAYFLRRISTTQGAKQEKITFTRKAGSTNEWIAEVNFYSPGEYIIRSVIVDGIERDLNVAEGAAPPSVTINGFSCYNFHGSNGQSYIYRTAENSVSETFYVNISAGDGLIPNKVEAFFQSEDGKSVTVRLTDPDRDTQYAGSATFSSSGIYTCKYLIIDGDYYELPTEIQREIYTGMQVSVWLVQADGDTFAEEEELQFTSGGYQYIHKGHTHNFNVQMRIYDSEGTAIEGLTNVSIYYSRDTYATLKWDPTIKYYTGPLNPISNSGYLRFEYAEVGFETISRAKNAMYIRAVPSDPVSYIGVNAIPEQVITISDYIDPSNPPARNVALQFSNASSATIFGKFSRTTSSGTTYYIIPAKSDTTVVTSYDGYYFELPDEDGVWLLEEIKMSGVYDSVTQTFFMTEDNGVLESLFPSNTDQVVKYIILPKDGEEAPNAWEEATEYYVVSPENENEWNSTIVLKTMHHVNALEDCKDHWFMQAYDVTNEISFLHEFNGVPGVTISYENVKLEYFVKSDGTISWDSIADSDTITLNDKKDAATINGSLTSNGSNKYAENTSLYLPGDYTVVWSYTLTVNGKTYTVEKTVPFTLSYKLPTVTISAIMPLGTYSYDNQDGEIRDYESGGCNDKTYDLNDAHIHANDGKGATSEIKNNEAIVYFRCYHDGEDEWKDTYKFHQYAENSSGKGAPTVTLKLADINGDYFDSARLTFAKESTSGDSTVHLYKSFDTESKNQQSYYEWTGEGEQTMFVGFMHYDNSIEGILGIGGQDDNTKTSAGTLKANTLVIDCQYGTFSITINPITIKNPN